MVWGVEIGAGAAPVRLRCSSSAAPVRLQCGSSAAPVRLQSFSNERQWALGATGVSIDLETVNELIVVVVVVVV